MENEMFIRSLKAIGDPTRLSIIKCLTDCCRNGAAVHEDGGVEGATAGTICCNITGAEKITSTVSHHLHELEEVGIIEMSRRGKAMFCRIRPEGLLRVADHLRKLAAECSCECC